jgi:hypothetical protein
MTTPPELAALRSTIDDVGGLKAAANRAFRDA